MIWSAAARATGDDRWERWHWEILGHMALGALAAVLHHHTAVGDGFLHADAHYGGWALIAQFTSYQYAGWIRHREKDGEGDTLRRDLRDGFVGYGAAVAVLTALGWWL